MNTRTTTLLTILVLTVAAPVFAWGPRTTSALVTTSAHLVSRDSRLALATLEDDIVNGANMPSSMIETLYPGFEGDL
ncbi:MAG: hypothetical protein QG656_1303, partial [Candidatus Hydrogenedentes bacterium]|nr:hypothetical protein [Candidatus Hydrogenedentota bacterium]